MKEKKEHVTYCQDCGRKIVRYEICPTCTGVFCSYCYIVNGHKHGVCR